MQEEGGAGRRVAGRPGARDERDSRRRRVLVREERDGEELGKIRALDAWLRRGLLVGGEDHAAVALLLRVDHGAVARGRVIAATLAFAARSVLGTRRNRN